MSVAAVKPHVFHKGDLARVVVPRFVTRVGYPKTIDDYIPAVDAHDADLLVFLQQLLGREVTTEIGTMHERLTDHFLQWGPVHRLKRDLAYLLAKRDGFGGRERSLHLRDWPEARGTIVEVYKLKTVNTGTYYPPSGTGYSSIDGDYDYEPGGLADMKRHRLAEVWQSDWQHKHPLIDLGVQWIEVANLAPVNR